MRIGLVGTGYWASFTHAPALATTPGATLTAVWGRDADATSALAARYGAIPCDDFGELLDEAGQITTRETADALGAIDLQRIPLPDPGRRRVLLLERHDASGDAKAGPHRLRHTYGTELASAGIDLLALRELMGHANPETTAAYVHLSPQTLAAEYARARAAAR